MLVVYVQAPTWLSGMHFQIERVDTISMEYDRAKYLV